MRSATISLLLLALASIPAAGEETWWSLRPLRRPEVPALLGPDAGRVRNPVDAFILAKLREKKLTPASEANRHTLIRRVTFDLTGLPPTPGEIQAFLADTRPDAFERLVDRLLASPAYGERWARHWMDAVHFAETHGHDQDRVRPNAWPYRDYLIRAFNEDRPYSRFVQEQIAGDTLFPERPDRLPALGLLAAGPWDESSLRDIREDSLDRLAGYYLDRDDMVSTVIATFNGLTVHCARCHNHKFDPISQQDYYSLQAVFAGVGRADRPYDLDPETAQRRQSLLAKLAALKNGDARTVAELRRPLLAAEVRAWEARVGKPTRWTPLEPSALTSANGSTLTQLGDGSVLSQGKRPERDVYTITATTNLKKITALRLEVLADDRLPKRGPGRQDNGNLHLSEIRILAAPANAIGKARDIPIAEAVADFDQQGWTIRHAIDGQPATAWGIYPQVGKSHQAILTFREPVSLETSTTFTIVLEQRHGGGHLIGRFRLSVTDAVPPFRTPALPPAVAAALAIPVEKRSAEQQQAVVTHYLQVKLEQELAALPAPRLVYAVAADFKPDGGHKPPRGPRPVFVLKRGDVTKPLTEAKPGVLSALKDLPHRFQLSDPQNEASRRAALARWITDAKNPLTWRVIVNRVWHHHFGRGIVDTPNDLGKMGGKPSHPELLDWLACDFRDNGQSLKRLHRLIVTSATYRQTSAHNPHNAAVDADNRLLWRMNRSRLDAESVRDAILLASDRLNRRMGGPSDQQFSMRPGIHVTPIVEYRGHDWGKPGGHRRSVYRFVFRTLPDPFVECLDGADASQLTPVRNTSVSPLQALGLLNNAFVLQQSKAFAAALEKRSNNRSWQVAQACERVWGRPPDRQESDEMLAYVRRHGLANLCRLLFNSSEFLFVD